MESDAERQLTLEDLFGEEVPEPADCAWSLSDLPGTLPGPEPDRELVESIKRLGVLQPVILVNRPLSGLAVVDGRRRIKAARQAGLTEVPARFYERDGLLSSVMTLVANQQRKPNAVAELDAILSLANAGAGEDVIREATGLPVGTIRRRLKLARLNRRLAEGMKAGRIILAVGERVASMPGEVQARLADRYESEGRLTMTDVEGERRVGVVEASAALPWEAIDTPALEGDAEDGEAPGAPPTACPSFPFAAPAPPPDTVSVPKALVEETLEALAGIRELLDTHEPAWYLQRHEKTLARLLTELQRAAAA